MLTAWLIFSALCSCAGWVLSAVHQLNAVGYGGVFLASLAVAWVLRKRLFPGKFRGWSLRKARRRFRRSFPLAFLLLALLAILGGLIHAPSNYDALAYRVPRVLHWLADGQWHWIHTDFQRLNTRACGIEWLSAPLMVFTQTDRWLFIINAASFCLLPGLVFSLFTRVGVRPRVAWHWMWLLPTGYCYLLQAGSIANDMFSTMYALAAIDLALRARKSGKASEVCLSVLAAALLTGTKATNLPLLLPWAIAFVPTWRIWFMRPLPVAVAILFGLGASLVPISVLNAKYVGDWTGWTAGTLAIGSGPAWLHLFVNSINWTLNNLTPPVFPFTSAWSQIANIMTPASLTALLEQHFEPGAAHWRLLELQVEEEAGMGFGLTTLLGLSLLAMVIGRERIVRSGTAQPGDWVKRLVCLSAWISLIFAMRKLNLSGGPRYLVGYYPLLVMGLLLSPVHSGLVRRNWWRAWAFFAYGLAGLLLVISPARPLWPAGWFLQQYGSRLQSSRLGSRLLNAYTTKGSRANVFAPIVAALPADASVLGFYADDYPESSLWKPFGARRILHVKRSDSPDAIRQRGIKYLLLTTDRLQEPWPEWLQRMDARELKMVKLKIQGHLPPLAWHLVELKPHGLNQNHPNPELKHSYEP